MGGASALLAMMPGGNQIDADALDEKALPHIEAIIYSMTPDERAKPSIINPKRKRRIAAGCGLTVEDVNKLLKQYDMMQKMMKRSSAIPKVSCAAWATLAAWAALKASAGKAHYKSGMTRSALRPTGCTI